MRKLRGAAKTPRAPRGAGRAPRGTLPGLSLALLAAQAELAVPIEEIEVKVAVTWAARAIVAYEAYAASPASPASRMKSLHLLLRGHGCEHEAREHAAESGPAVLAAVRREILAVRKRCGIVGEHPVVLSPHGSQRK